MTDDDRDPALQAVFASAGQDLTGDEFTAQVMSQTDKLKRRRIIRRIGLGLVLALLGIPLQDYGLALTQVLVMSLVDLDNLLLAQILAPVNSVATLLSLVLLGLRIAHKRMFS
ncbi:MAG: hypothetical protein ACE5KS_01375 [Woeseiaceae bacterium]